MAGKNFLDKSTEVKPTYPMEITNFLYKVNGKYWAYPILTNERIYVNGKVEDLVIFNNEGVILGGLHIDTNVIPNTMSPCQFSDDTVFMS